MVINVASLRVASPWCEVFAQRRAFRHNSRYPAILSFAPRVCLAGMPEGANNSGQFGNHLGNTPVPLRLKAWGNKIERAWRNAVKELMRQHLDHALSRRQLISASAGLGMSTVAAK